MGIAGKFTKAAIGKAIAPYKWWLIAAAVALVVGSYGWTFHAGAKAGAKQQREEDAKLLTDLATQNGQARGRIGELNGIIEQGNAEAAKKKEADRLAKEEAVRAGSVVAAQLASSKRRVSQLERQLRKGKSASPDCETLLSNPLLGKCLTYEHH